MKSDTKNVKRLFNYYKKYPILVILVIVLNLLFAFISLRSPIYEGKLLSYFENFDITKIITVELTLVVIRIIIEIVTNLWSRVILKLNARVNFDLKRDMLESL